MGEFIDDAVISVPNGIDCAVLLFTYRMSNCTFITNSHIMEIPYFNLNI